MCVTGQGYLNIHTIDGSRRWRRFLFSGMIASVNGVLSWTMEGDYHGQSWTRWCLWKKGALPVDIHHRLGSLCGEAARSCRKVFQWVESFNSGHETVKKVSVQVVNKHTAEKMQE